MSKHKRTINWDAVTRVIMVIISYIGTMTAGCYIARLVEYGVNQDGIMGLTLSVIIVITSLLGLVERKGE